MFFFVLGMAVALAQEEPVTDDLGNVSDAFQENFFEALKQKGIENYDLALDALDKAARAAKGDPEQLSIVSFERGKNYQALNQLEDAEQSYKEVLVQKGTHLDVLEALYDVYFLQRDYNAAIPLVKKLIVFDEDYKADLANLYVATQQFEAALTLLDELDDAWGPDSDRDTLRRRIYQATGDTEGAISNVQDKLNDNPENEQEYLNLIFLYSKEGNTEKAFETAKKLIEINPKAEVAHLALYKFYLDKNQTEEALRSMEIVFASEAIENEEKYKVLGDFIQYVDAHPSFEPQLTEVVAAFSEQASGAIYEQLGQFFLSKKQSKKALLFFQKGLEKEPDNYTLLKNTILLQINGEAYEEAAQLSDEGLALYPAQPLLYLLRGVAAIGQTDAATAIEQLEMGLDFLLDDPDMERDFYLQLSKAHQLQGNTKEADTYKQKAQQLKTSQ